MVAHDAGRARSGAGARRAARLGPGGEGRADRLATLPWRRLEHRLGPLELLSADEVEAIHEASLRILRDTGMRLLGDRAIDLFARDGARVDRDARRVRLDPERVTELVALAPATFRLHARDPQRYLDFGGRHLVFGAVGGPAFVSDLDRGRRPGTFADMCDFVRVIGALDVIHQEGGGPTEPTDVPVPIRHLEMYRAFATLLAKSWQCLGYGRVIVDDAIEVMSIVRGRTRQELLSEPSTMTIINSNSPLQLDGPMSEGLIELALNGQPAAMTPMCMAGAMSPITLAGALAQQNAEVLAMVCLAQLARPGAPVLYGGFTSNVDMRTGAPVFGTPEYVKAQLASGQLARRYRLPWRSSNVNASPAVDAQAAYEAMNSVWGALLSNANLVYQGAGWIESGLTASFEKLILDAEILQMASEVLRPFEVSEATLAVETIAEVGPGGHFFGTPHTLARYEDAFYRPLLSDWRNYEAWSEDGARTATERANRIWKRLLAEYQPPPLEPATAEALDAFVDRRKREILPGAA